MTTGLYKTTSRQPARWSGGNGLEQLYTLERAVRAFLFWPVVGDFVVQGAYVVARVVSRRRYAVTVVSGGLLGR